MSKSHCSWYSLWIRLGKQPYNRTYNKGIIIKHNGKFYKGKITFINDGKDFYLETTGEVREND